MGADCTLCATIKSVSQGNVLGCRFCLEDRTIESVVTGAQPWAILEGPAGSFLRKIGEKAHLIYIDPLFATGKVWKMPDKTPAFDDRFEDGRAFRDYLEALFQAAKRALAPEGSLVVHCDVRFQPLVRELLAELFGPGTFCDQIVWRYRRWPSPTRRCQRVHDYLVRYARTPKLARWTQLYEPLAASTLAQWGTKRQRAVMEGGGRVRSQSTEAESPGVPLGDVWDIPIIAPSAKERTGYPTQKPEALLDRAIRAWSLPGDLVVDPTLGSGTTGLVARRLDRRFLGFDWSSVAIRVATARMTSDTLATDPRRSHGHRRSQA